MAEATRMVTGRVMLPRAEDDETEAAPWPGALLFIDLVRDTYNVSAIYPARRAKKVIAEADGSFAVRLAPGNYKVMLPSQVVHGFTVELGDGTPIALSVLIAADIDEQDPRHATLLAALDGPASAATAAAIAADAAVTRADAAAVAAEDIVSRHTGLLLLQETADTVVLRAIAPVTLTDSSIDVVVGGTTYTLDTVLIQGA